MKPSSLFLCHCLAFAWYAFLVHMIRQTKPIGGTFDGFEAYGGPWKYLTVLNLVLQAFFYGVSLLADAFVLLKKYRIAKSMFSFRDLIFGGLAFPTSVFVCISFWTLYLYDRELVFPHSMDLVIEIWLNHAMHTLLLPLILLEMLITPRRYPSKGKGLGLVFTAASAYMCWILWIYSVSRRWPYPLFNALSPFSIVIVFLVSTAIYFLIYNTGEFLCRMIWGDTIVILDIYKKSK